MIHCITDITQAEEHPVVCMEMQKCILYWFNKEPKFRPIILSIGTIIHQVAKFLLPIAKPLETNEYVTKDSKQSKTQTMRSIKADDFLASMAIELLFVKLPLNETIEI